MSEMDNNPPGPVVGTRVNLGKKFQPQAKTIPFEQKPDQRYHSRQDLLNGSNTIDQIMKKPDRSMAKEDIDFLVHTVIQDPKQYLVKGIQQLYVLYTQNIHKKETAESLQNITATLHQDYEMNQWVDLVTHIDKEGQLRTLQNITRNMRALRAGYEADPSIVYTAMINEIGEIWNDSLTVREEIRQSLEEHAKTKRTGTISLMIFASRDSREALSRIESYVTSAEEALIIAPIKKEETTVVQEKLQNGC